MFILLQANAYLFEVIGTQGRDVAAMPNALYHQFQLLDER